MLPNGSMKLTVCCVVWFICCVRNCWSLTEIFAEEGKDKSLDCLGNRTNHIKNIWWISKNTVLSKCHPGIQRCSNNFARKYTASQSETYQKYTSKLTIHQVGPDNRDQTFYCEDDGREHNNQRSFVLRGYHLPENPMCAAEELSRGRIKVLCETSKVYPGVRCEITQEFHLMFNNFDYVNSSFATVRTETIEYKTRSFKEGTTNYSSASCSSIITTTQTGLYRFKVKMYPSITNILVASVDGYTNNVTIQFPAEKGASGKESEEEITQKSISSRGKQPMRAEALTNYQSSGNTQRETIKSDTDVQNVAQMCENSKDEIIQKQLIVIMFLTALVACTFLMNVLPKMLTSLCKRRKLKDPNGV